MPLQVAIEIDRDRDGGDVRGEEFDTHIQRRIQPAPALWPNPSPVDQIE